jgi:hypothetical protein
MSAARIAEQAWREVVALHAFFEAWLRAGSALTDLSECEGALGPDFRMIGPNGAAEERAAVLSWIKVARGSRPADFAISVLDPLTVWANENAVLLEYTEQQYRDGETTRRRSTALFLASPSAPRGVEWRHLQETWIGAE